MIAPFVRFGPSHLAAIGLAFITPVVLTVVTRAVHSGGTIRMVAWLFGALIVVSKISGLTLLYRDGELTVESLVPMHLCDWAAIMVLITLIYPNQWTYELCYFWALGGTLQALLTPDLRYGFPHAQCVYFFTQHGAVIAAALYMTLAMGMRPFPMSIVRVLGWSALYLAAAMAVNSLFGTNFGYLRSKPEQPSLLDYMAPWPFYIAEVALLAIASCLIYYAPFFIIDRLQSR